MDNKDKAKDGAAPRTPEIETIDKILAWLRHVPDEHFANNFQREEMRDKLADRIEAAIEEERGRWAELVDFERGIQKQMTDMMRNLCDSFDKTLKGRWPKEGGAGR